MAALAGHPAHHPVGVLGVLALPQLGRVVRGEDLLDVRAALEGVRIRVDAFLAEALDLRAALLLGGARLDLGHGAKPTVTRSSPS